MVVKVGTGLDIVALNREMIDHKGILSLATGTVTNVCTQRFLRPESTACVEIATGGCDSELLTLDLPF